ncbi:MAG TPA: GAF domain-containing protein [Anaerolineae bacterium]|nr:GAF domain-containing protein [Anaerolineae bacterium]
MGNTIKRLLTPPVFAGDEQKTHVAALLNTILWIFIAVCIAAGFFFVFLPNPELSLPLVGGFLLSNGALLWLMRRGQVSSASMMFLVVFWFLMLAVSFFLGGTQSATYWSFVVIVVAAGLLLGGRGAIAFAGLSVAATLGIALAQTANLLPGRLGVRSPMEQWWPLSLFLMATAGLINLTSNSWGEALRRARRYAAELEEQRARLAETVQERTVELTRRTRYLEATAVIAHEATSELALSPLMDSVVDSISRKFSFYYTGLFLVDGTGEWLELVAASGEGGQKLLARGYRLRVGGNEVVGEVSQSGKARIALDTAQDFVTFDDPDLPLTRSEAALPLRARGKVIGVLDVQSAESEAFSPEDVAVLQMLADQIATAINNARLFRQIEESFEAERSAYGGVSGQAWANLLNAQTDLGFVSDRQAILPVGDTWTPQMRTALTQGQMTTDVENTALAIPIKVRGRVIGVMDGHKSGGRQWTQEEIALMQTLAEQSALALESARLYQDTQRRAAREQVTREITDALQRAVSMEALMRIATEELNRSLRGSHTYVRLNLGEAPPAEPPVSADEPTPSAAPLLEPGDGDHE